MQLSGKGIVQNHFINMALRPLAVFFCVYPLRRKEKCCRIEWIMRGYAYELPEMRAQDRK